MTKKVGFLGNRAEGRYGSPENTGNFIHGAAARRIVGEYEEISSLDDSEEALEHIRSTCSHIGFVAANGLVTNTESPWIESQTRTAKFIKKLGLPVVVFGLGAQARQGQAVADCTVSEGLRFYLHVLSEYSESIAVRGEFTADLCRSLGVMNVEVTGCQSCFMNLDPHFQFPTLKEVDPSRGIYNFTNLRKELGLLRQAQSSHGTFIGQNSVFELALAALRDVPRLDELPQYIAALSQKQSRQLGLFHEGLLDFRAYCNWVRDRFHQFYSAKEWFDFLDAGEFDFCIGTRFHGNMASLQRGIPSLWVTHDSRTLEFCEYLGLPHISLDRVRSGMPVEALVAEYLDGSKFNSVYPRNYRALFDYLEGSGIQHVLPAPTKARGSHVANVTTQSSPASTR